MIRFKKASIRHNELSTLHVDVPAWELPVLQAVHGGSVVETGEFLVDRDPPSAADEFERLTNRYKEAPGEDGSISKLPFVAAVYGQFNIGVTALTAAIREATVVKAPAKQRAKSNADLVGDQVSAGG